MNPIASADTKLHSHHDDWSQWTVKRRKTKSINVPGKKRCTGAFFCLSIPNTDEPWTFGSRCSPEKWRAKKVLKINTITDADTVHAEQAVRSFWKFTALIAMTIPLHPHIFHSAQSKWSMGATSKFIHFFFFTVTLWSRAEQQCANVASVFVCNTFLNQSPSFRIDSVRSLLQLFELVSDLFPKRIQQKTKSEPNDSRQFRFQTFVSIQDAILGYPSQ